jgi:hypothetical protein
VSAEREVEMEYREVESALCYGTDYIFALLPLLERIVRQKRLTSGTSEPEAET